MARVSPGIKYSQTPFGTKFEEPQARRNGVLLIEDGLARGVPLLRFVFEFFLEAVCVVHSGALYTSVSGVCRGLPDQPEVYQVIGPKITAKDRQFDLANISKGRGEKFVVLETSY